MTFKFHITESIRMEIQVNGNLSKVDSFSKKRPAGFIAASEIPVPSCEGKAHKTL
jgi:hypothetical protein